MTKEEKSSIKDLQRVLMSIDNGSPVFFNLALFKEWGLVFTKKKYTTNACGNKVERGTTFHLTEKGKTYLNIAI